MQQVKDAQKKHIMVFLFSILFAFVSFPFQSGKAAPQTGEWQRYGQYSWYFKVDGSYLHKEWGRIKGKWYLFDTDGKMITGWKKESGKWYFLWGQEKDPKDEKGYEMGQMIASEFVPWKNKRYYLGKDGAMCENGWYEMEREFTLEKSNEKIKKNYWHYFFHGGEMADGWQKINGKWYYFKGGAMMTGLYSVAKNKTYYFGKNGVMCIGWHKIEIEEIEKSFWFYFGDDGIMRTGWQTIDGKTYYFSSGVMIVGLFTDKNAFYYFASDGHMVRNTTVTIEGYPIYFGSDGKAQGI